MLARENYLESGMRGMSVGVCKMFQPCWGLSPFWSPHRACLSSPGTWDPPCLLGRTCHRISTEVVVWGVTDTMVGASSGAGERDRHMSSGGWGLGPLEATGSRFFCKSGRRGPGALTLV